MFHGFYIYFQIIVSPFRCDSGVWGVRGVAQGSPKSPRGRPEPPRAVFIDCGAILACNFVPLRFAFDILDKFTEEESKFS